jgi:iron complex outermembrane receptor protein
MISYVTVNRTLLTSALALTLGAAPAWAQIVAGTVRSGGRPIVGATVRLLELDRVERTGVGGDFRFQDVPNGTYRVYVGMLGYASATDTVRVDGPTANLAFELVASAAPLREIVVSAAPLARPADEQYQAAESRSRIPFATSAGMTFAEKISDLPGVSVRGLGSAPSRPILRGLGDNEVLILENGLRMGDIATYDPAHATPIDALSIEQIDVVRGPATILYGPNTIGGLVNVITNIVPDVASRPVSGTVALEGNTGSDQYAAYSNLVLSGGHSAFQIAAGELHAGATRIPSGTYTDPGSGASFTLDRIPQTFDHSGEASLGYALQGAFGSIGIGGKHYEMNYGIPGVPPNPNWATVPPTTSRIAQDRNTIELRSLFNVGGALAHRVRFDAAYNDYNHSEFPTAQDSTGVSEPQANHFHKREFNAVLQLQQRPVGRLSGTLGLWTDIQDLTIEGDQPLGPNSRTTGLAAYAYEEFRLAPRTRLQGGVRLDYNGIKARPDPTSTDSVFRTFSASRTSNAATASLGAIHQLGSRLTASFSVGRSFRAPTVQELFANGLDAASGTYSIGTASLGPENGLGVDASLKGDFGAASFEFSPYLNYINHYIYGFLRGDTIQGFPVRQFTATDSRLMGFEASVNVVPMRALGLRASVDYVNAQDTQNDVPLPFIPPLRGLLRATWQQGAYSGLVEWRLAAAQNRLGEGDTPTAGYTVTNVGIGLKLVRNSTVSVLSLRCDNVFDTVYRDNLSVIKDFVPQPGRAFRLNYELVY